MFHIQFNRTHVVSPGLSVKELSAPYQFDSEAEMYAFIEETLAESEWTNVHVSSSNRILPVRCGAR